jgi:hypothetical protein
MYKNRKQEEPSRIRDRNTHIDHNSQNVLQKEAMFEGICFSPYQDLL